MNGWAFIGDTWHYLRNGRKLCDNTQPEKTPVKKSLGGAEILAACRKCEVLLRTKAVPVWVHRRNRATRGAQPSFFGGVR